MSTSSVVPDVGSAFDGSPLTLCTAPYSVPLRRSHHEGEDVISEFTQELSRAQPLNTCSVNSVPFAQNAAQERS